ncbi:hypothetical protein GCM10027614_02480 [Micromonospora vulcania]
MIEQGLPVGNGRLGALASNDPAQEHLTITDATLWTGGRNDTLQSDGQFPYGRDDFGSLTLLATLTVDIPGHDLAAVDNYRRTLDLAQGLVGSTYDIGGVTYRRQIFASRPDDVIVLHFSQEGRGDYTGTVSLAGTHGETTTANSAGRYASFGASFANGLRYGAAVTAYSSTGKVAVSGTSISFTGCREVTVVVSGGTNYSPTRPPGSATRPRSPSAWPGPRSWPRPVSRYATCCTPTSPTSARRSSSSPSTSARPPRSSANWTPGSGRRRAGGTTSPTRNLRPRTCSSVVIC